MKNFNETGITLIALAVTIIILIILAGISISTLNGKNGILNQANSAKIMTIVSGVKEEIELKNVECQVEDISINIENLLKEKLKKDRTKTQVEGFTKLDLMEMTRKHICSHKE